MARRNPGRGNGILRRPVENSNASSQDSAEALGPSAGLSESWDATTEYLGGSSECSNGRSRYSAHIICHFTVAPGRSWLLSGFSLSTGQLNVGGSSRHSPEGKTQPGRR